MRKIRLSEIGGLTGNGFLSQCPRTQRQHATAPPSRNPLPRGVRPVLLLLYLVALFCSPMTPSAPAQAPATTITGSLPANDDGSTGLIPLGFTFRFFGTDYNSLYVNNNGNLTFLAPLSIFTPYAFPSTAGTPMIAPFFADVDTRNGKGTVTYEGNASYFRVNWTNVGYFNAFSTNNPDYRNSFSVTIQKNNGIVFEYEAMNWTTGDASGGGQGFGGCPATLGLDKGDGVGSVVFRRYGDASVTSLYGTSWYFQTDKAVLPTPVFKQYEGYPTDSWGIDLTLNGTCNMRSTGCFVTSAAMVLNSIGHNIKPDNLNLFLRDYMPGGDLLFLKVPQDTLFFGQPDEVPGPKVRFRSAFFVAVPSPLPLPPEGDTNLKQQIVSQIAQAIATYGPVILRVPSRNWGLHQYGRSHAHAIVAYDVSEGDVLIRDPGWAFSPGTLDEYVDFVNNHVANVLNPPHPEWQLTNADGSVGGNDFSWIKDNVFTYTEVLTPFVEPIIQGEVHSPVEIVITDPQGRRFGYDPVRRIHYSEIPHSVSYREQAAAPADDAPMPPESSVNLPNVFELGDIQDGPYTFEVYGVGTGPWAINFGVSHPVFGYNRNAYLLSGTATPNSFVKLVRRISTDPTAPIDTNPPEVKCTADREILWPPDHKMVEVKLRIEASDDKSAPEKLTLNSVLLTSSEPDNSIADGDTKGDCNGADGYTAPVEVAGAFTRVSTNPDGKRVFEGSIKLRAERGAGSSGRIYTISAYVSDETGNQGSQSRVVVVLENKDFDPSNVEATRNIFGANEAVRRLFETNRMIKYSKGK